MKTIIYLPGISGAADPAELGGKAANLARLGDMGQAVPPWYALTASAFDDVLASAGLVKRIQAALPETGKPTPTDLEMVRKWIGAAEFPEAIRIAILHAHSKMIPAGACVAVRSSALGEDSSGHSFAGLHDSFLYIRSERELLEGIRKVWASVYNERALAYRRQHGLPISHLAIAVVVQQMVDADVSGVAFTMDPVSGSVQHLLISALFGAGEGLVSAGLDADTFRVSKSDFSVVAQVVDKQHQMLPVSPELSGLQRVAVPEWRRQTASLAEAQLRKLAEAALEIECAYGQPQDIEFAWDAAGRLHILQARPITTASEYGPAAGNHLIWDNSNIIESYAGVTSPMTFSFIRHAYTIVYHCFAQVMGISDAKVKANSKVFENMLGLIRGQVYYNLLNWYRLIRLFPGFNFNKRFMESMMGVKEPVELRKETGNPTLWQRYAVELPALVRLLLRSSFNFIRIRTLVGDFEAHFHKHYTCWEAMDFNGMRPYELMDVYREMEDQLLWNWRAPIINDFYVMIYYGTLKSLCQKWCADENGSLQNDLICGEGGIESTEPTKLLLRLATRAQSDAELRRRILNDPPEVLVREIPVDPRFSDFNAEIKRYLKLYGFRCMNELKLEEYSLRDRPDFLYVILRNYLAINRPEALDVEAMHTREQTIRRDAEDRAFRALTKLSFGTFRLLFFRRILRNARLGVKNRENMRFARTRIYGLLRDLLRALGRQLAQEAIIATADDIFFLTLDECWDFIKGTAVTTDLPALVRIRKAEFDAYRHDAERLPDDRFDTYGIVYHKNLFQSLQQKKGLESGVMLRGIGCCPGVVTGPVKVLRSPRDDCRLAGEILVAERTDPGWVPLYPAVSGILIERGSILSHSAIVAREMGIPTIIGIPHLIDTLQTGQIIKMNGNSGTVEVVKVASTSA